MITSNSNLSCEDAALHYYDILIAEDNAAIPAEVLSHIQNCNLCQNEINRLCEKLKDKSNSKFNEIITTNLQIQYSYLGTEVGCDQVRPFLPGLADRALETRVLTPITAHLDNCKQCSDDLEIIRKLNLNNTQACKLGQLFAEKFDADSDLCNQSSRAIPAIARLDFMGVPEQVLKHICLCHCCRKMLADKWHQQIGSVRDNLRQQFSKEHVSDHELLCFAVPYLTKHRDISDHVASHTIKCAKCFKRLLNLHHTIFEIYSRPQSGTVTRMVINPCSQNSTGVEAENAENPLRIEVTHKSSFVNRPDRLQKKLNLKPFIRPAMAAMLVIALSLYFTKSTIASVDLAQIYKELAKAVNVHIKRFAPNKAEPVQEQWVSRALNVIVYKTPVEIVVWNLPENTRTTRHNKTGDSETISVPADSQETIRQNIEGSLGLFPFQILADLPRNSKWQEVTDAKIRDGQTDFKIYDLLWSTESENNSVVLKKWRVFIDSKTNLPQRVEWYSKGNNDETYLLTAYALVNYLNESEIRAVIGKGDY